MTVTKCELGGSVVVRADGVGNEPVTLPTPGEITLSLTPGPHSLIYQRDIEVLAGNVIGTADPLRAMSPGATASIEIVDPPEAGLASPSH